MRDVPSDKSVSPIHGQNATGCPGLVRHTKVASKKGADVGRQHGRKRQTRPPIAVQNRAPHTVNGSDSVPAMVQKRAAAEKGNYGVPPGSVIAVVLGDCVRAKMGARDRGNIAEDYMPEVR